MSKLGLRMKKSFVEIKPISVVEHLEIWHLTKLLQKQKRCSFLGDTVYILKKFWLHLFLYLLMRWFWWDWPLTWLSNHCPSVLWCCCLGHKTRKIVSEITYNVSNGTLNSTIPYHFWYLWKTKQAGQAKLSVVVVLVVVVVVVVVVDFKSENWLSSQMHVTSQMISYCTQWSHVHLLLHSMESHSLKWRFFFAYVLTFRVSHCLMMQLQTREFGAARMKRGPKDHSSRPQRSTTIGEFLPH